MQERWAWADSREPVGRNSLVVAAADNLDSPAAVEAGSRDIAVAAAGADIAAGEDIEAAVAAADIAVEADIAAAAVAADIAVADN